MSRVSVVDLFKTRSSSNQKFVAGCLGLKDVQITMPEAVIKGREATLQCTFELEGEKLYSLKW